MKDEMSERCHQSLKGISAEVTSYVSE